MAEGAVCDDGIDIFVLQLELSETQYEGRVDDNGTENDTISACWSDKMPHGLVDKDDVVPGDCDRVLVACYIGLSFMDILKFDLIMPVPVHDGSVGSGAVYRGKFYRISTEQEFLCAFLIKIGSHKNILSFKSILHFFWLL